MPARRAIARPSRILLAAAALYLVAAWWRPARVDLQSPVDGVFFNPEPAPAIAPGDGSGSLLAALAAAAPRAERSWLETPFELNGHAELSFELYQRARRELLIRAQSGAARPVLLSVRANQVTLRDVSLQPAERFYRWRLPAGALQLGSNRFRLELRDPSGRPAEGRISWARVSGSTLPVSRSAARIAQACLGEIELPALVQAPGTALLLDLEPPANQVLRFSIGAYSRSGSRPVEWTFQVATVGPEGRATSLFSRRLETGGSTVWQPARIVLPRAAPQLKLLFVVEGIAAPEEYALWGNPLLEYRGGG